MSAFDIHEDEDALSSDPEEVEIPVSRFSHAGKESIELIISNTLNDRKTSKILVMQVVYGQKGAPGSEFNAQLWKNRWETFWTSTMKKR